MVSIKWGRPKGKSSLASSSAGRMSQAESRYQIKSNKGKYTSVLTKNPRGLKFEGRQKVLSQPLITSHDPKRVVVCEVDFA